MPYHLEPIQDDPVSEAERRERLKNLQREQAQTLREKLGGPLYDWLEEFCDDMGFLTED